MHRAKKTLKPLATWMLLATGCSYASPTSSFAFELRGDVNERVTGIEAATGEIDDQGDLALDDGAWRVAMNLMGLDARSQSIARGTGLLSISNSATGEVFTTDSGGSCTVTLEPHQSTNGSAVTGSFYCSGLASPASGHHVDVLGGTFRTQIDDAQNNPSTVPL
jgi:hypothetical protein